MMPSLGNFGQGLPAFLGVVLGIQLCTGGPMWTVSCVAVLGLAIVLLFVGRSVSKKHPVTGSWIIEAWIISPVCITALLTALIVWLSANWPPVFGSSKNPEVQKALASALIGAVTAYAALVWTKDISDGTGLFWPSTQFKAAMKGALDRAKEPSDAEHEAIFSETVDGPPKIVGWGFNARRRRARIVDDYVRR